MIKSEQQRRKIAAGATSNTVTGNVATVATVAEDGITLVLPGETTAGTKKYPYNAACTFSPGQRVHVTRESGTIIVEYPLGGMQAL